MADKKILTMQVDLWGLMVEAAEVAKSPAITMGFNIAHKCLQQIAAEACNVGNVKICESLQVLGYIKPPTG